MRCVNPKTIWPHRSVAWCDRNEEYSIQVPCNKCIACLSNKRQDWAFRLQQEFKFSQSALFVTLTYDEKHLRSNRSLCKRDVQLYLKRLRKRNGTKSFIRYYAVGEYGTKSNRPHYHILLFNADVLDVREAWIDSKGKSIGIVHIGQVTEASISYTIKYIVQPPTELGDLEPPFALMSRAYGIGGRYLSDEMVQWHRENDANYAMVYRQKVRLPRFYKSKIWYDVTDRERVSKLSLMQSIVAQEKERQYFIDNYGNDWLRVYTEMRDAVLDSVKVKVAFTQKF